MEHYNTINLLLLYYLISSSLLHLIIRVDLNTFKEHPLLSSIILLYSGPLGWGIWISRILQALFDNKNYCTQEP